MKTCVMLLSVLALLASFVHADSIDDAEAKQRGISVEQVQLENAKARIKILEAKIDELNKKLALLESSKQPASAPSATTALPVSVPLPTAPSTITQSHFSKPTDPNAKKVILSMHDYYRLPVFLKYFHQTPGDVDYDARGRWAPQGTPMGFTAVKMDAVGYITSAKVVNIIDDSTAIVEVAIYDPATGLPKGAETKTLIIDGMPTTGQARDGSWSLKTWFKVVATRTQTGTTYFVGQQILPETPFDALHPNPFH